MQTKVIKINPDFPEVDLIKEAAGVLRNGGLVAFPTETVYGIAANFLNAKAIDRLYNIKKRPRDKPFTFHIADLGALQYLGITLSTPAEKIASKFWPGPLTILALNKKGEKLGIRMPKNNIALALIREASVPVVAPSANISGNKPPVSSHDVTKDIGAFIDMVIDGGDTEIGIESSILDVGTEPFNVIREAAIEKKDLLADYHVLFVCTGNSCRSVMAKALLEKFLKQAGFFEKVYVDSAGTLTYKGIKAAPNTVTVMDEEGMDVSGHIGKPITRELLKKSDLIFVMERVHRNFILNMMPEADQKIMLLRETEDIPDPIGRGLEEYKDVLEIIKDQTENIFLELFKKKI